jgi:hypothetical protein
MEEIEVSEDPNIGLQLKCLHCHTTVEVTWLFPLTLDFIDKNSIGEIKAVTDKEI